MKKFPNIIHVTIEGESKEQWFQVSKDGVFDAAEAGQSKPCAIYKLVEVGTVIAPPQFVSRKRAR